MVVSLTGAVNGIADPCHVSHPIPLLLGWTVFLWLLLWVPLLCIMVTRMDTATLIYESLSGSPEDMKNNHQICPSSMDWGIPLRFPSTSNQNFYFERKGVKAKLHSNISALVSSFNVLIPPTQSRKGSYIFSVWPLMSLCFLYPV